MPRERNILLIGHSHVNCVQAAARRDGNLPWLRVINLRRLDAETSLDRAVQAAASGFDPAAVCLCLGGNFHNVVGTLEHPVPFSLGTMGIAGDPDYKPRHMIPRALVRALFRQRAYPDLVPRLYDFFPQAERLMLNAPPPVADFDHIRAFPGIHAGKLGLGPAPSELRLSLYALQTEVFRAIAEEHAARFITQPDAIFDSDGFLAKPYFNNDPTHGNQAYGLEMASLLQTSLRCAA